MYLERYAHAFNQPKKELSAKLKKSLIKFLIFLDISGSASPTSQTMA